MAWVFLVAAGLFETAFAVLLKLSHGLTDPWPTAGFAVSALISFGLLTVALRELEVGPAYAVWTGIGAAGAATAGIIWLGDSVSAAKVVSIAMVKRRRGYPVSPQVRVTAVRPPGMKRQTTMSCVPNRASDRSAHA